MNELPTIHRSAMTANAMNLGAIGIGGHQAIAVSTAKPIDFSDGNLNDRSDPLQVYKQMSAGSRTVVHIPDEEPTVAAPKRRLVRVLVVDPDENVPTEKCLLHSGAEQFTDATDQELFFEIDIKGVLDKHNEYRVTLVDKKATGDKEKKLEPARIRDLKMVVVSLAEF